MGHYHMILKPGEIYLCTTILNWSEFKYYRILIVISVYPDILQEKVSLILKSFNILRAYLDCIMVISKGDCYYHLDKILKTIQKLAEYELKVNNKK